MSSSDGNVPPDGGNKFLPPSSNRSSNILPTPMKLPDVSTGEVVSSTYPSSVPLDLASKSEFSYPSGGGIPRLSMPPVSTIPIRLKSQAKQETRTSMSPMKHKIIRGPAAAITAQPAMRAATGDMHPAAPRAPFKMDQLVKISDNRVNTATSQPVGIRVPVTISMSTAPPMASIMRAGNPGVINSSTTIHPLISQHCPSTNPGSSIQYTHVPIGPAAIASITVQKSAAVATPVRPQFTMTHLNPSHKIGGNIGGVSPQQQFPISPAIHIKDSGVQLPSTAITVGRQQISLNMPSAMLVTPAAKPLPAPANLTAIPSTTDKLRVTPDSSAATSLPVDQIVSTVSQPSRPHSTYAHQLAQSEDKGFLKQAASGTGMLGGVTIAMTCASEIEQLKEVSGVASSSSYVTATTLSSPHTLMQDAQTSSMSQAVTSTPYLPHPSSKPVHQPQTVLPSTNSSRNRSAGSHQNKPVTHIVHTGAPIPLKCQPANKSGIAVGKHVAAIQALSAPNSSSTASRPKAASTATIASNVPIAKVYPQQAIASPSSATVQGRLQAADLPNRNVGVNLQQQHNYGGSTVKLPVGMVTNVPQPSSSVPRTTTLNLSAASSHATVATALPTHPAATDRPTVSVDIGSSLPYAPPNTYYYGHQSLERATLHQQHSPQPKQTTPIRPSGSHTSQPVRLGQMVVTVNPNRPHQLALHPTSSNVDGVTVSLSESGMNAAQPQQLPTVYTISAPLASSSANVSNASPYVPITTTAAPAGTSSHMPPSSPRPSILRKRPSELSTSTIRKNLMGVSNLNTTDTDSPSKQLGLLKSPMKTSEVGHDRNVCEKIVVKQELDNSESGVDAKLTGSNLTFSNNNNNNSSNGTASSSSSCSGSTTPSNINGNVANNNAPAYEASPRKKPRKQQLLANELKEVQSSDGEEDNKILKTEGNIKLEGIKQHSVTKTKSSGGSKEEESSKWEDLRKQYSLINTYRHSWKTCNNHFLRPTDIKSKDEKKMTVNDLANQRYICQKINGWKLHHFSVQMDDLVQLESDIHDKLSNLLVRLEEIQMKCDGNEERDIHRTNELVKANLQRSKLISQQMTDTKGQVFKIFDHKPHVLDIINKYVSKRSLKKRERF